MAEPERRTVERTCTVRLGETIEINGVPVRLRLIRRGRIELEVGEPPLPVKRVPRTIDKSSTIGYTPPQ
jgi:hypothetical protein